MAWSTVNRCLFTAALFQHPTPWLDEEMAAHAAGCGPGPECCPARVQVMGLPESRAEREAEYTRLFVLNPRGACVQPFGSYWLEPGRQLAGVTTREVEERMFRHGLTPAGGLLPDHLAAELEFLAWLLDRQYPEEAHWLLDRHLRAWTPDFLEALRQADPHPFYRGAATFLESTLAEAGALVAPARQQREVVE